MTGRRLRRLDMRGLIAIHQELMARYGGGSRAVELPMLELSIVRSESVVGEQHWRSRARLAAGYGWRILMNRPFAEGNKRMALAAIDLPGDERLHVEQWRGGRDGHGAASRRERNEGRRVGSVGGEERGEEGVGEEGACWMNTRNCQKQQLWPPANSDRALANY